jgi:hypothetical protein
MIKRHKPRANRVGLQADEGCLYIALNAGDLPRPFAYAYREHRINKGLASGGGADLLVLAVDSCSADSAPPAIPLLVSAGPPGPLRRG